MALSLLSPPTADASRKLGGVARTPQG